MKCGKNVRERKTQPQEKFEKNTPQIPRFGNLALHNPPLTMDKLATTFLKVSSLASTVDNVWLGKKHGLPTGSIADANCMSFIRTVKDIDENNTRQYLENYTLVDDAAVDLGTISLNHSPKPVFYERSPSGDVVVAGYNAPLAGGSTATKEGSYLEITSPDGVYRIDTSAVHGKLTAGWFGGCSFDPEAGQFVYTALVSKLPKSSNMDSLTSTTLKGNQYEYEEDWGEKFVDVAHLGLFILCISDHCVRPVDGLDPEYSIGQPVFVSRNSIAYTAWMKKPRMLGMIYCYQRACRIMLATRTDPATAAATADAAADAPADALGTATGGADTWQHTCITSSLALARSPRVDALGERVLFLGHVDGFVAHNSAMSLYLYHLTTGTLEILASAQSKPIDGFAGVYTDQLPKQPFLGESVCCNCYCAGTECLLTVNLSTKAVNLMAWGQLLPKPDTQASGTLLAVNGTAVVVSVSSPCNPPVLLVTDFHNLSSTVFSQQKVFPCSLKLSLTNRPDVLQGLRYKVFNHTSEGLAFQATLLYDATHFGEKQSRMPIVLVPHGGPHSVTSHAFVASYASVCLSLHCAVLHVNYRGSIGFGDDSLNSLLGRVGTADVADMMQALHHVLRLDAEQLQDDAIVHPHVLEELDLSVLPVSSVFDTQRIAVVGGSHGGFLGAHLCAQFPEVFRAAALRNPVIDMPSMLQVTDIPGMRPSLCCCAAE